MSFTRRPFDPDAHVELRHTVTAVRQRVDEDLSTLAAIERELDRLDRQLSGLRAQLARHGQRQN